MKIKEKGEMIKLLTEHEIAVKIFDDVLGTAKSK